MERAWSFTAPGYGLVLEATDQPRRRVCAGRAVDHREFWRLNEPLGVGSGLLVSFTLMVPVENEEEPRGLKCTSTA